MKGTSLKIALLSLLLLSGVALFAQTDTTVKSTDTTGQKSNSLLNDLMTTQDQASLLPDRMVFTQRWLWGKKGLMRHFDGFELSEEERLRELKIRRTMLTVHQALGIATLAGMVAQGILGYKVYNGHSNLIPIHNAVGIGVATGYFATASMSLFAPPRMVEPPRGITAIKIHEGLAIIHFTAMVSVLALTSGIETHPKLRPWHRAAALTAFGAYGAAVISITFK